MTPPPPALSLAASELPRAILARVRLAFAARGIARGAPGDGHPVLVIPGFISGDASTAAMRRLLVARGYDARGWGLGRNLGPRTIGPDGALLLERLEAIAAETGRRVSLIGWSLGGIMARLLAAWRPDLVRQVITLGAPYAGDPRATNVWRLYQYLAGHAIDAPEAQALHARSAGRPRVPTTAVYSRADGIVAWRICRDANGACDDAVEVRGGHVGMIADREVVGIVLDRLALPEGTFVRYVAPAATPAWWTVLARRPVTAGVPSTQRGQ